MGCDWYRVSYCIGIGYLFEYNGNVTSFIKKCKKKKIDEILFDKLYILGYTISKYDKQKSTYFYGNLTNQIGFELPGPYEITENYLEYTCKDVMVNIENNVINQIEDIVNIIATGETKILTTCYEEEIKEKYYDNGVESEDESE